MDYDSVLITGGTGTLGRALIRHMLEVIEVSPRHITVFSRDEMKQQALKKMWPSVKCVLGDIMDYNTVEKVIVGHDLVIHAAAMKHIPAGEFNPGVSKLVNVDGSENVAIAAARGGVERVVMISTDKACHPVNTYGLTKMMMERITQEQARIWESTRFSLVRYGNVLGSTGSVLNAWEKTAPQGFINITDPDMTRFWMSEEDAVRVVMDSLEVPSGSTLIPKIGSMSMSEFAEAFYLDAEPHIVGLRPGEKLHEELTTFEELPRLAEDDDYFMLFPVGVEPTQGKQVLEPYTSKVAPRLTVKEVRHMAGWENLP